MIDENEAREKILASVPSLLGIKVPLRDALDHFAGEDLNAAIALPSFANSAMDGYAVIAASATQGARLKVTGEQPAGAAKNRRVNAGEAIRIFTGALIPEGADAVVMQEDVDREGDFVIIREPVTAGEFVRRPGTDLAAGQKILHRGDRISPAILGLLASQGFTSIQVSRRPAVAIVTTGDEIVAPGKSLKAGEIFESNGLLLSALAKRTGATVAPCSHVRDELPGLCVTLREASRGDAVIISGGVSVGERDLVRRALLEIGATIDLWRVKIKPGKPFLFGRRGDCAIFGLPGNPVSSFVTFLVLVRPALLKMMGAKDLDLPQSSARLRNDAASDESRPHYIRGRLENGHFSAIGRQESHALYGLARANALLRVEPGEKIAAGSEVTVALFE